MRPIIRTAVEADLPRLLEIYNDEVEHGTATFDTEPLTLDERRLWLLEHNQGNHPLIVLECEGAVWGYASLSTFKAKHAYASSTELSVYVHRSARGRGYGERLTRSILALAEEDPLTHRVYSCITSENTASIALHRKLGFLLIGTFTQAGRKFGRWLDVTYWEKAV